MGLDGEGSDNGRVRKGMAIMDNGWDGGGGRGVIDGEVGWDYGWSRRFGWGGVWIMVWCVRVWMLWIMARMVEEE